MAYIILNDGTKWKVNDNNLPMVGSGPYRAVIYDDAETDKGVTATPKKTQTASQPKQQTAAATTNTTNTTNTTVTYSDSEIRKAAAEAEAKRKADREAAQKAKERQEKLDALAGYKKEAQDYLAQGYDLQKEVAKQANDENMRQLYIAYMQGLKNIPQQTALWGAGGEIESLKLRGRLNYEDNRAKEQSNYTGVIADIEKSYRKDLQELEDRYLSRLLSI